MIVLDVDDGPIGEDLFDALPEDFPFICAVEVVDHEKASAIEVIPKAFGLGVADRPVAYFDRVQPRPVIYLIGIDIDDFFGGTGVDAGQSADALYKLALRFV